MPPDAETLHVAQQWLRYAEADLAIANAPLPVKGLYEHLCFHAQQAAEKAIKAVLTLHGIEISPKHTMQKFR